MNPLFAVIHEDEDLLVVHKPADLVCHPTKGDEYSSLISRARIYLKAESEPHLVNRLDRETSGLVVIAKNPVADRELKKIVARNPMTRQPVTLTSNVPHGNAAAGVLGINPETM